MQDTAFTLVAPCRHESEIRKSRFLAQAAPVDDAATAMAFVRDLSDRTATHNCWAYRIGQDYRFNDDGEPGGSAGKPILAAIDGQKLDRVAVVVTRWFGGIKLGVGGLLRAYGGMAAECLRQAERVPIVALTRVAVECGLGELPLLKSRLQACAATVEREDFDGMHATLTLGLPQQHLDEFTRMVANLTRGRSAPRRLD
jgi:uncharacterized YigZ family protein